MGRVIRKDQDLEQVASHKEVIVKTSLLPIAGIKAMTKSNVGKKGFIPSYSSVCYQGK